MRTRSDIESGKFQTPREIWQSYCQELYRELVLSVTEERLRKDIAPNLGADAA